MAMDGSEELDGSELGTKAFWDAAYSREVENFKSHKDVGEVWFGEDSMDRVIRYVERCDEITESSSILDVGCGNGLFLIELACAGYTDVTGVDYAADAVKLARMVAEDKKVAVTFETADFMSVSTSESAGTELPACLRRQYDVVHDKGTYDAVSLSPDNPKEERLRYIESVRRLVRPGGLLLITSCNWTASELTAHLCPTFLHVKTLPTPSFSFGGCSGSVVSSLVFRRPD
ncbi:EEF1A lysine methyltransferase 2-like [Amphibalanus amphitrite]|uniref:EEF1A lysine methyltransferase 2-like n=1 Tax=Amphibalanus amphitrite TaxID=1232801 RepID=UPI001C91B75C|nr:EEF1A lysine methyltransferase 2-like [Amphibalanus amphitrite]XP_043247642.1 EEF1A lysine methyltransferase 2-like [Amphibalanus amphitrite]